MLQNNMSKYVVTVLLLFAAFSCSKEAAPPETIKTSPVEQPMTSPMKAETCSDWYWVTWDANGNFLSREYINTECVSSSGGITGNSLPQAPAGGSGGYLSSKNTVPTSKKGIDCEVFNFVTTISNWQECGVNHMKINVVWFPPAGGPQVYISSTFTQPVVFGMPRTRANGTQYGPGYCAQISAVMCSYAGAMIADKYEHAPVAPSQSEIESEYRKALSGLMRNYGGTADRNGSGSPKILIREADYKILGNGNCDDSNLVL